MRLKLLVSIALLGVALQRIAGAPVPQVTLTDVPSEALIGEDFKFKVTFQNVGNAIGFGPFIDVVLDAGGADLKKGCTSNICDGISFVSAKVVGINGGPVSFATFPVSANCGPTPTTTQLTHPFASNGIQLLPVTVPAGGQLVAIQLPFGSYDPTQPVIVVEVTAHLSPFADQGVPLTISARGGFQFGADAQNNAPPDWPIVGDTISGNTPPNDQQTNSSLWSAQAITTPKVMVIKKECAAPEGETATGPNYPRTYTITVDIADGQSIANLKVQDILPNNVQYLGSLQAYIHTGLATQVTACGAGLKYVLTPPGPGPGGTLTVAFCNPIVGAPVPAADVTISFKVYVPDKDANGNPVLPANCRAVASVNGVHAAGDWTQTPADPCDTTPTPPIHVVDGTTSACSFTDKCLAIQKTVTDISTGLKPKPGDTLRYVYTFQVSDYLSIGKITVTDFLADGQTLVPGNAQLMVRDQYGTKSGAFPAVAISSTLDPTGALEYCRPQVLPPFSTPAGGTVLTFNISQAMGILAPVIPTQNAGILIGGYAAGPPMSSQAAIGSVVFLAKINDDFHLPIPTPTPADKYVDKDDPINNCIVIDGMVYHNVNRPNIPNVITGNAHDDSETNITIVTDTPKKTVYSVKRGGSFVCNPSGPLCSNSPSPPQEVRPGDVVTFRIQKTIPTSDAENLTIRDWLPLPVFDVHDPNADGVPGPFWNGGSVGLIPACGSAPPAPGNVCRFTPSDTLGLPWSTGFPTLPTLIVGASQLGSNSIEFDYGTFNDPSNLPRKIDLLFSSTITYQPFADGLPLANEMQECETNTFGNQFCQAAVAQVNVREPRLVIHKGVVATDSPYGTITPRPTPLGKWASFGVGSICSRFSPPITSANLPGLINGNLSNADANDWVTFAIAIENVGGAAAYDIQFDDIFPCGPLDLPSCFTPDYSTVCIRRGNGGPPIPFTSSIGGHCRRKFAINSGFFLPAANATGSNIFIITFNAQLLPDIQPGCCDNLTDLLHYSSKPGGPDFVSAGFTPPFGDTATVCVGPRALAKCIVQTSEAHTAPQNSGSGAPPVAIGEIIRYRLVASVPEGVSPSYQIKDLLPAGVIYLGNPTVGFVSTNPGNVTSSTLSGPGLNFSGNESTTRCAPKTNPSLTYSLLPNYVTVGTGGDVTFDLGTLTNTENDQDMELAVIEFNALVNNVPSNVTGTVLTNKFELNVNGQPFDQNNSISVNANVVEPNLVLTKGVGPVNQAGLNPVTVTVKNTGAADAFDVQVTDTLPTGLSFSGPPTVTVSPTGCAVPGAPSISGNTITLNIPRIPPASSCSVQLAFAVQATSQCFTNTAQATYSSLPGNGTQPNSTGSVTPCSLANHQDCERVYNASGQGGINTGCNPTCATPPGNMAAWWALDEPNGATAVNDMIGFNNQGVPQPGPALGSPGNPTAVAGKVAGAVKFGLTNYLEVGDQPEIDFGTGDLSIDAWVYPATANGPNRIQPIVDKLPGNQGYALYLQGSHVHFDIGSTSLAHYISAGPPIPANTWTHVAVTIAHSTNTVSLYVNGSLVSWATGSGPLPSGSTDNSAKLWIGGSRLTLMRDEITIDELEFFKTAINSTDIQKIVHAGALGKCKCVLITNENVTCNSDGTYNYTFTATNLSTSPIAQLNFTAITNGVTITPAQQIVSLPVGGGSAQVTLTLGGVGATSGATVCFSVVTVGPVQGCNTQHCVTLPTCQGPCASPPPHMVSWWPLDETSANTVVDIIGGHNGTTSSNIGVDPTVTAGMVGGALFFNYSNAAVSTVGNPYNFGTGSFSIDGWVRTGVHNPGLYGGIVDKLDNTSLPTGFALFIDSSGSTGSVVLQMGTATFTSNSGFLYNVWQHVAVTVQRNGSSLVGTFYINGAQVGPTFTPPPSSVNNGIPLLIGAYRPNALIPGPGPCLSCEISLDEIEIFDDVVLAADIKKIFDAGSIGKCRH